MKRLYMCVAALAVGVVLVVSGGCDGKTESTKAGPTKTPGYTIAEDDYYAEKAEQEAAGMRSKANFAKEEGRQLGAELQSRLTHEIDKTNRIIEELGKKDALPSLRNHLVEIKLKRDALEVSAKKYELDSLNALTAMKRYKDEEKQQREKYTNLMEEVGTKPENLEQTYQIGSRSLTGENIMAILKSYKNAAFAASKKATDQENDSGHCKQMAQDIRSNWIPPYEKLIEDTERTIRDCERLGEFGGLIDGADSLREKARGELAETQKQVDNMKNSLNLSTTTIVGEAMAQENAPDGRNRYKITDDDWD